MIHFWHNCYYSKTRPNLHIEHDFIDPGSQHLDIRIYSIQSLPCTSDSPRGCPQHIPYIPLRLANEWTPRISPTRVDFPLSIGCTLHSIGDGITVFAVCFFAVVMISQRYLGLLKDLKMTEKNRRKG